MVAQGPDSPLAQPPLPPPPHPHPTPNTHPSHKSPLHALDIVSGL